MAIRENSLAGREEELRSQLVSAAYRAASQQGFQVALIDAELDLWNAVQAVMDNKSGSASSGMAVSAVNPVTMMIPAAISGF